MPTTDLDIHAHPIQGRHTTIGGHLITCGTYIIGIILDGDHAQRVATLLERYGLAETDEPA